MNRIREGYVLTKNPMNPLQISRITLSPDIIDCIVFWTKDPANLLDKLSELDALGYLYYFQLTLNPYGREIEHNLRDNIERIKTFQQLSDTIGKDRVIWRYDPIILNEKFTRDYHRDAFTTMCRQLQGYTDTCTISFVDTYSKQSKFVKEQVIKRITEEQMHELSSLLSEIGKNHGIELRACCEKFDLSEDGIKPAACIDKNIVERISGRVLTIKKDKSQREGCGCYQSVDIGVYNTCKHGCVYCYANHSDSSIQKNYLLHNPTSDILVGKVEEHAKITNRGER